MHKTVETRTVIILVQVQSRMYLCTPSCEPRPALVRSSLLRLVAHLEDYLLSHRGISCKTCVDGHTVTIAVKSINKLMM